MQGPGDEGDRRLRIGDWILDRGSQRLIRGDEARPLNPKEMSVLLHLIERAPRLATSDQLIERTWPDVVVGDHTLHEVIARLRKALGDRASNPHYIETLARRGYRLIAPVRNVVDPLPPQRRRWPWRGAAISLVAAALLLGLWWIQSPAPTSTAGFAPVSLATVAVLPLENLSADPENAFFSEAVSREIWSQLAAVDGLRLISRTAAATYQDSGLNPREIGARLTADYLIDGSARRTGDEVSVTVRLLDARSGGERWRIRRFGRATSPTELFALLDDISRRIGAALPQTIAGLAALEQPRHAGTTNLAAYNLVQRSIFEMQRTAEPRTSLSLAEQALAIDPSYWKAHQAVAAFHFWIAEFGWGPARPHLELAKASIERALQVGDGPIGNAYVVLGQLATRLEPDFPRALKMYERAEALGADPHYLAGAKQDLLLAAGDYEAGLALAREQAALSPGLGAALLAVARFQRELGQRDEARATFEQALERSPDNTFVFRNVLEHYLLHDRDPRRARQIIDASPLTGKHGVARELALSAHLNGDPQPLRELLQRARRGGAERFRRPKHLSHDAFLIGDYEAHLHWFQARIESCDLLGWVAYELRESPTYRGYWEKLRQWAASDSALAERRSARIESHRVLLERLTAKMHLPR